jgi:hypothetical protein
VTSRPVAALLLGGFAATVTVAVVTVGPVLGDVHAHRTIGYGQIRYDGAGPERWARRARVARRRVVELRAEVAALHQDLRRERRVVLHDPNVVEAINLACATYPGYCATLWRKARCETGGTFDPHAANSSGASGLFQFMPSTWASTPYGVFSIWSPYANALAAGWMHEHGRGSEWACR